MHTTGPITLLELFVLLVAGSVFVALITRRTVVPYSVGLVLLGLAVAALPLAVEFEASPELLLAVLLPGLVFEAAYRTNARVLVATLPAVALLAIPGVLLTAGTVALVLSSTTSIGLSASFLIGTMLAATDPAAVISVLGQLRAPARLKTLIEAESLFNDGTGIVIFAIAVEALQVDVSATDMIVRLLVAVAVSISVGAGVGLAATRLLRRVQDHLLELTISLVAAYGSYLVAERLGQSGLIATVMCGLLLGNHARHVALSGRGQDAVDTVWEFIGFLMTTVVFLLIGLTISLQQLVDVALPALATLLALLVSRALAVYLLLGGGSRLGQRLGWARAMPAAWLHLVAWSGLRGAVAVALALSLPASLPNREQVQSIVFACVLMTLILQGGTAELLVRWLGLERNESPLGRETALETAPDA
jgi:CPA1 family monovalent cation:H+ antiporter